MQDLLTFKTFITPSLLFVIYYIGAVSIPLVSYLLARWIKTVYFTKVSTQINETIVAQTTVKLLLAFIFCFICMEVFWRVLFEFFIAYFDMHDALMQLSKA